jgi:hypothetical protein
LSKLIKCYIILIGFFSFTLIAEDNIIIEYGLKKKPDKSFHSFDDIKTLKFVINPEKIEYFKQLKEEEIKNLNNNEVNEIIKLSISEAEKNNRIMNCDRIENKDYKENKEQKYTEAHTKIRISNQEYCIIGKTKIVEKLSREFNLNLKWKKKITGEITIFYGMRRGPHPNIINYSELFEKKIVISRNNIKFYSYIGYNKYKLKEVKRLEKSEYMEIKKIVNETIANEKSEICAIFNTSYGHAEKVQVRELYSKLETDGGEICAKGLSSQGVTKILIYLDKKYNLNIEWAKKVFF